ncbi:MAG TPA: DUF4168 domain-containing protein [Kiloniellaceae bacterium]
MPRRLPLARPLGVLILPVAIAAGIASAQATPALQNTPLQPAPAAVQLAQAMGTPAEAYSEQQLQAYAAAVMKVQEIDRAWQPKIGQAQTQEEAEAMTTEATNEMIGEIEGQGLSVEEYNAITQAAEQDQQLYDRIMTLLAQAPR